MAFYPDVGYGKKNYTNKKIKDCKKLNTKD